MLTGASAVSRRELSIRLSCCQMLSNVCGCITGLSMAPSTNSQSLQRLILTGTLGNSRFTMLNARDAAVLGSVASESSLNQFFCPPDSSIWSSSLGRKAGAWERSEEHTSELQSRPHLVCRLLLEKKKQ